MIRIDSTQHSTVVWCTQCPSWRVGATHREAAYPLGADHERRVHPEHDQMRARMQKAMWRATRRDSAGA